VTDPAVQYGPSSRYRAVGPLRVGLEKSIKDIGRKIVARRVMKQLTVIPPNNAKYRIAQTHGTFDDCIKDWLSIGRRLADKVEHLARRGLMLQRLF
jgi:hypothetical protein